ncbi:MAG: hypothetical protein QME68_02590, partial [Elusimicrobiota bacterium]|nr:hypothetical protein [Elusimicrobiota bacterium]
KISLHDSVSSYKKSFCRLKHGSLNRYFSTLKCWVQYRSKTDFTFIVMDAASKLFILMIIVAIIVGIVVIFAVPEFRITNIYQSNRSYYSATTPESLKKSYKIPEVSPTLEPTTSIDY